ncbi:MAG: hypothetical protein JST84_17755 [Acidobacteria bacterium]|nr:hypothetical protein [Acidobacteriota bacterium]
MTFAGKTDVTRFVIDVARNPYAVAKVFYLSVQVAKIQMASPAARQ